MRYHRGFDMAKKQYIRQKIGKALIDTNYHHMNIDAQENIKKDILIKAVAGQEGITESQALDLILTDDTSEYFRKFTLITEIHDLKRRGQFKAARDLEKEDEMRYKNENRLEYMEYRKYCRAQQKALKEMQKSRKASKSR